MFEAHPARPLSGPSTARRLLGCRSAEATRIHGRHGCPMIAAVNRRRSVPGSTKAHPTAHEHGCRRARATHQPRNCAKSCFACFSCRAH